MHTVPNIVTNSLRNNLNNFQVAAIFTRVLAKLFKKEFHVDADQNTNKQLTAHQYDVRVFQIQIKEGSGVMGMWGTWSRRQGQCGAVGYERYYPGLSKHAP